MSERSIALLSLNVIATIANFLASAYDAGWRDHWSQVAYAANLTSYMFQALTAARSRLMARRTYYGYTRRIVEVSE